MSYIVAVRRTIQKHEVLGIVADDPSLSVKHEYDDFLCPQWLSGDTKSELQWFQGELTATTPSDLMLAKLEAIGTKLGATVVGEEDGAPASARPLAPGTATGSVTWIGWPVMVAVLSALLVWRW